MLPTTIAPMVTTRRPPARARPPGARQDDPLTVLQGYAAAQHRPCQAPTLAAELTRRLDRAASTLQPPAVVARELGRDAAPLTSPLVRAWVAQVLRLPPPLVLLVLARARWFLPAHGPAWRRRAALARALLDGLERPGYPVDAALRAFLLASPAIEPDSGPALARGLAAYAARDYLTSLHLLVPRLEAILRCLTHQLTDRTAADTTAVEPGAIRNLDGLLGHEPLRRALGDGLVVQLRGVLLTNGALRHRLAHGRLAPAACTRRVTQDVILCYLRLSRCAVPAAPALVTAPPGRNLAVRNGSAAPSNHAQGRRT